MSFQFLGYIFKIFKGCFARAPANFLKIKSHYFIYIFESVFLFSKFWLANWYSVNVAFSSSSECRYGVLKHFRTALVAPVNCNGKENCKRSRVKPQKQEKFSKIWANLTKINKLYHNLQKQFKNVASLTVTIGKSKMEIFGLD